MAEYDLSEEQLAELKEAFSLFDKDGNESVSVEELGSVLRALGQQPTDDELQLMIDSVDANKNGAIDFQEFVVLMKSHLASEGAEGNEDDDLMEAFRVFDKDGNGFISEQELKSAMLSLGERITGEELRLMLKAADTDGNGQIDYQEFVAMLRNK